MLLGGLNLQCESAKVMPKFGVLTARPVVRRNTPIVHRLCVAPELCRYYDKAFVGHSVRLPNKRYPRQDHIMVKPHYRLYKEVVAHRYICLRADPFT